MLQDSAGLLEEYPLSVFLRLHHNSIPWSEMFLKWFFHEEDPFPLHLPLLQVLAHRVFFPAQLPCQRPQPAFESSLQPLRFARILRTKH